jgi:tetratricopeptide (TPR) repeat protein/SAM-dependent methyltransferase
VVGRNDACPCGSGRKYKQCCGAVATAPPARAPAPPGGFEAARALFAARRYADAERACERALAAAPRTLDGWFLVAAAAFEQQAYDRALRAMRRAAKHFPESAEVRFNLGRIREAQGDGAAAIDDYKTAVRLKPDYPEGWMNLGNALKAADRLAAAADAYREATRCAPASAPAWSNLGVVLKLAGESGEALRCQRRAIACDPGYAPAHNNLGNALLAGGDARSAEASYREALRLDPRFAEAHANLAGVLRAAGRADEALAACRAALRLAPDDAAYWPVFAECVRGLRVTKDDPQLRDELVHALACRAVDPLDLVPVAASVLRHAAVVLEADALDTSLREGRSVPLMRDALLLALLESAVIADWDVEQALVRMRCALLRRVVAGDALSPEALSFAARLAVQCFLTEYVYPETGDERAGAAALADGVEAALAAGRKPEADRLAVLACYRPLHALRGAAGLPGQRPAGLEPLVAVQVEARREEERLRARLPVLGAITDPVSRAVQAQYEEHPYPRWARIAMAPPRPLLQFVRAVAPGTAAPAGVDVDAPAVLVAGAGTGRHPLQTASRIRGAKVLAIDLSAASLAYAARQARALGIANIEFMQADILALGEAGGLTPRFDLIESFGVLHHLRDPMAGWRVLAGLLKPGGFMTVGFYSERARQPVVACRERVRTGGYGSTAADIRRFRQDLVREGPAELAAAMRASPDFYSVSDCRDLVFHVEEHRYALPQLVAAGEVLGLRWLGLDIDDPALLAASAALSPRPRRADDVEWWDRVEQAHPQAFAGTYKLWWQKP